MYSETRGRGTRGRRWAAAAVLAVLAAGLVLGAGGCGKRKAPVVVIGMDGATWDLLVPWMEQGKLPHIQSFMNEAAVGSLLTVYPILSPVCWTSGFTGVNPGKHGIYDFQKQDPNGEGQLLETATNRRATPIWMLLSDAGYRVGVLNVPMTYPPDPVRGRMISGFPFPSGDVNYTYPPEYQKSLGPYLLDFLGESLFTRTQAEMLKGIQDRQEDRFRVADRWIKSGKYDFIWMVFTASDKVQHFFWKDMDPNHPEHTAEGAQQFGDAIQNVWERLDVMFGDLVAALPPDATVLVMSDHGFGPIYRQLNLQNWIQDTDLPEWIADHAVPKMTITNGIMHYEVQGGIEGSSDRQAFIDKFEAMAENLHDPKTGLCPFEHIFRREDIYKGPMVEKAPDVVFQEIPHYYVTRGVPDSVQKNVPYFQDVWTTSFTANHRPQGVIAVRGPGVHRNTEGDIKDRLNSGGDFKGARIIDVTPSLLALMGQVVPQAMDGRVWTEVMKPDFLKKHPVTVKEVPGFLLDRAPVENLTPEQKEQMKALPYIQ